MIKNESLVSVIIPLYNAEKYIRETIESVLQQTYINWELLIVDDCSTDSSREIVKEFERKDTRIKLIESEVNFGGPARPRNIGIENSKGEYIAFLDADDIWLKYKLEKQLKCIHYNKVDIIHTLANTIDDGSNYIGELKNQKFYNILKYICNNLTILYFYNFININTVLMKKDINLKFREDKNLIALEDWLYWIDNIYNKKNSFLLKEKLINYRLVSNSISNRNSDKHYRKTFYIFSLLFNENKITLRLYILSFLITVYKIVTKRIKLSIHKK